MLWHFQARLLWGRVLGAWASCACEFDASLPRLDGLRCGYGCWSHSWSGNWSLGLRRIVLGFRCASERDATLLRDGLHGAILGCFRRLRRGLDRVVNQRGSPGERADNLKGGRAMVLVQGESSETNAGEARAGGVGPCRGAHSSVACQVGGGSQGDLAGNGSSSSRGGYGSAVGRLALRGALQGLCQERGMVLLGLGDGRPPKLRRRLVVGRHGRIWWLVGVSCRVVLGDRLDVCGVGTPGQHVGRGVAVIWISQHYE